jgi:hypothetical protein
MGMPNKSTWMAFMLKITQQRPIGLELKKGTLARDLTVNQKLHETVCETHQIPASAKTYRPKSELEF